MTLGTCLLEGVGTETTTCLGVVLAVAQGGGWEGFSLLSSPSATPGLISGANSFETHNGWVWKPP